jgi:hypothetical protein
MSDLITVDVKGIGQLKLNMEAFQKELVMGLEAVLQPAAEDVRKEIVNQAPEDTGFMKKHVDVVMTRNADNMKAYIGPNHTAVYPPKGQKSKGEPAVKVAKILEFGRRGIAVRDVWEYLTGKKAGQKRKKPLKKKYKTRLGGNAFITRAWESRKASVEQKIRSGVAALIARFRATS